ncbi:cell wall-binding repeat-containing protein [Clostridium sp. WILCCON 0269]|uniref:Cell wall-binding repeat-containing protein n=1 Tax=Candidatus Clostridium eludens TaxID=3381663 RepID=A0ABW8SG44_9CLOT
MEKIIGAAAAAAMVFCISNTAYAKTTYNVTRFAGLDRYETSAKIANNFEGETLQNIILASGKDFADALGGSVLSKKHNAPILLLNDNVNDNSDAIEYIKNHLDKNGAIYALGGTASISDELLDYIKQLGYTNITRLGGQNRFDTNKSVVNSMNVEKGTPIVIANGWGFADALSISSAAASKGYPIFMTDDAALPEETKSLISSINPEQVYIIGGQGSVKDNVISQLKSLVPSLNDNSIIRVWGQDRYETSLNICKYFDLSADTAVLASGADFPDALSGSALASKLNAPVILTDGSDISNQKIFMDEKAYKNIFILGGIASIDLPVEYLLKAPSDVSQLEKDYINNLKNYCESYKSKSNTSSSQLAQVYTNATNIMTNLNSASSIDEISEDLKQLIQSFQQGSSYLSVYKNDLTSLRDEVSNLSIPEGLETLNKQYLDSINAEIEAVNTSLNYTNQCTDILTSLKDAVDNSDIDKMDTEASKLQDLSKDAESNLDIANKDNGIDSLYTQITTSLNNLGQ